VYHWLITASLLFAGVAGTETQATIPKQFRGSWAASAAHCAAASAESKLTLRETAVDFHESRGRVLAVATQGNTELALLIEASGEGQSWLDARRFRLSEDRQTLTDVTGGRRQAVRVRCSSGVE
jgi:hypothetical protein